MRSLPGKSAVIKHENLIRLHYARGSLRHDKCRHISLKASDRFPERGVRREVERARTVVHNQDLRPLHERAGDREPLLLAAGQIPAALLDLKIKTAFLALHHVLCLRRLKRAPDCIVGGIFISPAHIVADRTRKEHRLLRDDTDLLNERALRVLSHVHTVDENRAARHIVEARNQIDKRRLAAAGSADDADRLSLLRFK